MHRRSTLPFIGALLMILSTMTAMAAPPRVAASIPPVHSLAAAIMHGVAEPDLLEPGSTDIEGYDLLFWVGPWLERELNDEIFFVPPGLTVETLSTAPGIEVYAPRQRGMWSGPLTEGRQDPYHWLDPKNARIWAARIASALTVADPVNAGAYAVNARRLSTALIAFDRETARELETLRTTPFITDRDVTQYLEGRYELSGVGSLAGETDIEKARDRLRRSGAVCLLSTDADLAARVVEGTRARTRTIDPLGTALEPGPMLYLTLMRQTVQSLTDCLDG